MLKSIVQLCNIFDAVVDNNGESWLLDAGSWFTYGSRCYKILEA